MDEEKVMNKSNENLTFPDYHPKKNSPWKRMGQLWNTQKTETMEEAIATIRTRLGWAVFLLVMILLALGDISEKLGD